MLSMDNFSHNGEKLESAITEFAETWSERGLADKGFEKYVKDRKLVSFPWSMIDKITPRPDKAIKKILDEDGVEGNEIIITEKQTYIAPFVNAEKSQYLVIEDDFPNGRPPLETAGVYLTDRITVDKTERMKVCTCLNPLHTALAVFGCLLGFKKISDEMNDPLLKKLVYNLGYKEGLPVVTDPVIISPDSFLKEVLEERIPNPFLPDTPQRIATDTSQKLPIRYGETIRAYMEDPDRDAGELKLIPLVIAGWIRYLMGIDDEGAEFTLSPDPLAEKLGNITAGLCFGLDDRERVERIIGPLLANKEIFGADLKKAGLYDKVIDMYMEMAKGSGCVKKTLEKYVNER
jgi:fructuronate reductase